MLVQPVMESRAPVRVVMTAYNRPQFLAEAIEGILRQTFKEYEFIIVDDGSADNAVRDIVSKYQRQDSRITYIRQENTGPAGARNFGASCKSAGWRFICFADDDDISLPNRIEEQYNFLTAHPEYSAVSCEKICINEAGKRIKRDKRKRDGFYPCLPNGPGLFIERSAYMSIGGFRQWFRGAEDADFALRFAEKYKAARLGKHLIHYRLHGRGNLSGSIKAWHYYCAAAYSAHCRANGLPDPAAGGMALDEVLKIIADAAADLPADTLFIARALKQGMATARGFIRDNDSKSLLLLIDEISAVLGGFAQSHRRKLQRYALLKGKWKLMTEMKNG